MHAKYRKATVWLVVLILIVSCKTQQNTLRTENKFVPGTYGTSTDTANSATINWRVYFADPYLVALIDTALRNNQELNKLVQEIEIRRNEIKARKGEYLPFVGIGAGAGVEKTPQFTRSGAVEEQLEVEPGKSFPHPYTDYNIGFSASWELDIWKKLRNAKNAAANKYLASIEGRNFMITNLIAEIASSYYELMALDNMLSIIDANIQIQANALQTVKRQKESAMVTMLAVNRFEAQLLHTQNLQFEINQQRVEVENRINYLTGRFPKPIARNSDSFLNLRVDSIQVGVPTQLLQNRPDVKQAEYNLVASKLNVKVARANFYPSLTIKAGVGLQAFNPAYLIRPESILMNLAGDLMAPLINRNAIKAAYNNAKAEQISAVITYEQTLLNAYIDVLNQVSKVSNYQKSFEIKRQEVEILRQSVNIANQLFNAARADYAEVLLTQREALDAKLELVETQRILLQSKVNLYRALGGGWM